MRSRYLIKVIKSLFSLAEDKADPNDIDEDIRSGVILRGTNLWVLILAVIIASVGLNVNSPAVVIGAMLISPLMGPIMGIGYGVGIYDFPLIRLAALNLAKASLIALITSTLYFLITPLSEANTELLARTAPTIWDVLIAFSGGLAGIIAATRHIKTNVIPGVAIATALMPPLCTAGYGLANAKWNFFFGASYLFFINCVFIAFATIIIISASRLPHKKFVDSNTENKVRNYIAILVLLTVVPSLYLAYNLVKHEIFSQNAQTFINQPYLFEDAHVTDLNIDAEKKKIEVTLIGEPVTRKTLTTIQNKMAKEKLAGASLIVHQASEQKVDTYSLKSSIIADLYKESQQTLDNKNKEIDALKEKLNDYQGQDKRISDVAPELKVLFPQVNHIVISDGLGLNMTDEKNQEKITVLIVRANKTMPKAELNRLENWLKTRLNIQNIKLIAEVER